MLSVTMLQETMLHVCENCPGKQDIQNYLRHCVTNNENELDEVILYMQWVSTDWTTMNKLASTMEEYINPLCEKVFELCEHHFVSKAQFGFLKYKKETFIGWSNYITWFCWKLYAHLPRCCSGILLGKLLGNSAPLCCLLQEYKWKSRNSKFMCCFRPMET